VNVRSLRVVGALVVATFFAGTVSIAQFSVSALGAVVSPSDKAPPIIHRPADISVTSTDGAGAVVNYEVPSARDNMDEAVPVACNPPSGAFFPIGATAVTCTAKDAAGNAAIPVTFVVTVAMPLPTSTPIPTSPPLPTDIPISTNTPIPPSTAEPTATVIPTDEPSSTRTEVPSTGTPKATTSPTRTATPAALALPASPPAPYIPIIGGGPIDGLSLIWGDLNFPISQEYGHTDYSLSHPDKYAYGALYGLDGRAHPGIDIGMPAGTWLYSPVDGTVLIAGGNPFYSFYGNTQFGVGELMIQTDAGDQVILGHLGRIAVSPGQRVTTGQFVGLSGGDNGDHLHLEVRLGGYHIVDPRQSFLVAAIADFRVRSQQLNCQSLITVEAEADAWIERKNPSRNQGADTVLRVRSFDGGDNTRGLIRFAMPDKMPEGCVIGSATLRLSSPSATPNHDIKVLRLTGDWTETEVTWGNQPANANPSAATSSHQGALEWDVTKQVQAMFDKGQNYGFLIRDATEDGDGVDQQFVSREQGENAPELVIQFAVTPESTPTPTATPASSASTEATPEATPD
jgi:murein DD-endopeptidase MepM/ murein hydrolase activator NlpD